MVEINFSALPYTVKNNNPFGNILLSIGITLCILAAMALGALLSADNNREDIMFLLGSFAVFTLFAISIWAVRRMFLSLSKQREAMRNFAEQNGWQYEGKRSAVQSDMVPPGMAGLAGNTIQRFCITGKWDDSQFKYCQLMTGKPGSVNFAVVLRVLNKGQKASRTTSEVNLEYANGYDYFIFPGNVISRYETQKIFKTAGMM